MTWIVVTRLTTVQLRFIYLKVQGLNIKYCPSNSLVTTTCNQPAADCWQPTIMHTLQQS